MPAKSISIWIVTVTAFITLPARSQNARPPIQLPDGEGKETVQVVCAACHSLGNITNSGHNAEEWKTTVAMMRNVGANLPADKVDVVTNYLIKNFPEKPAPLRGSHPRQRVEVSVSRVESADTWIAPT